MALALVFFGVIASPVVAAVSRTPGVALSPHKPALFERNDGQFSADIAFRAEFSRVSAAIHADGSFSVQAGRVPAGDVAPVRFTLRGARKDGGARARNKSRPTAPITFAEV